MIRRALVVMVAGAAMIACSKFEEGAPSDGGAADGAPGKPVRDGAAPGTFCADQIDAGFCDDFDTSPTLMPIWVKSSATGCDLSLDSTEKNSAPRALSASCSNVGTSNHISLPKISFSRMMNLRFAMRLGAHAGANVRLLSFTSEGRTFALVLTDAGVSAQIDVGLTAATRVLPFAKDLPSGQWVQIRIEVYFDDVDGHVFIDVDDNRVVEQSRLFTYKHGQTTQQNPLVFGTDPVAAGGRVDVSFDDIVIDRATLAR